MNDKYIVLRADRPPEFVGTWKIGEIMMMLDAFRRWLEDIPISE